MSVQAVGCSGMSSLSLGSSAGSASAVSSSSAAAVSVSHRDISNALRQLYAKYPNITQDDWASYEELLGRAEAVYDDASLPLMVVRAPLPIIKKHIEIMERMVARDKQAKAAGEPGSGLVNEKEWPLSLTKFLNMAIVMLPSREVLEFLVEKGAKLLTTGIDMFKMHDRNLEGMKSIRDCYAAGVDFGISFIKRSGSTTEGLSQVREEDEILAEIKEEITTSPAYRNFRQHLATSYSPEAIECIFSLAFRQMQADGNAEVSDLADQLDQGASLSDLAQKV